jgi:hypothetical protein
MNADERLRWFSLLEKSRALLDRPAPEPTRDLFRPDALEAWARNMPKPAPVKPTEEIRSRSAPEPAPIDWASEIDERVEAAIEHIVGNAFEIVGESLGELLRKQRQESKDELAGEVRKLWAVLAELQSTLAALTRIGVTGKAEVLDLPALPRARDLN